MDTNNFYQGLIQTKTIIIPIIRNLGPSKDYHTVIDLQTDPSPNVTKVSDILTMTEDDERGQQIVHINIPGRQDIFSLWGK